jgi:peptidoglycan/LPS O-acetylase OafA/YrhL
MIADGFPKAGPAAIASPSPYSLTGTRRGSGGHRILELIERRAPALEPQDDSRGRIKGLDALRGLAALTVVAWHYLAVLKPIPAWLYPLRGLWAGPLAVEVFFVLSGLVLALPLWHWRIDYGSFVIRRILRIYPLYWVAVGFATVVVAALGLPGVGTFVPGHVSTALLAAHVALIGRFNVDSLNPPIWSLVHEIRVSLLIPVLVILLRRRALIMLTVVYVVCAAGAWAITRRFPAFDSYAETLRVVPVFAVGALLGLHRRRLADGWRRLPAWARVALPLLAFAVYTAESFRSPGLLATPPIAVFIVAAMSPGRYQEVLLSRPLQLLGGLSYGIYLLHLPVLYLVSRAQLPFVLLWAVSLVLTLVLAALLHSVVELPFIRLGRFLTRPRQGDTHELVHA